MSRTFMPRELGTPGPSITEGLLEQAQLLAKKAGALTLRWFETGTEVMSKGDGSPVTQADRAAEQLLRDELERCFPTDAIVGEEFADTEGISGRTWIIDPIDGTQSFIRGVPLFATLLALEDQNGVAVGVVDLPALGVTLAAGRGLGCFVNDQPATVNATGHLDGAVLCVSSFELLPRRLAAQLHDSPLMLRGWGDAYGYYLVASGRVEAMVDPVVSPWDVAPMAVIIPEAGGTFTDLSGRTDVRSGSGLATNGKLHQEILDLLANCQ